MIEGTFNEIQASNLDFAKLLLSSVELSNEAENETTNKKNSDSNLIFDRQISVTSAVSLNGKSKTGDDLRKPVEVVEKRSSGNISFSVYLTYLFSGGREIKILFFIFICILTQVCISSGDVWVTHWYYSHV